MSSTTGVSEWVCYPQKQDPSKQGNGKNAL